MHNKNDIEAASSSTQNADSELIFSDLHPEIMSKLLKYLSTVDQTNLMAALGKQYMPGSHQRMIKDFFCYVETLKLRRNEIHTSVFSKVLDEVNQHREILGSKKQLLETTLNDLIRPLNDLRERLENIPRVVRGASFRGTKKFIKDHSFFSMSVALSGGLALTGALAKQICAESNSTDLHQVEYTPTTLLWFFCLIAPYSDDMLMLASMFSLILIVYHLDSHLEQHPLDADLDDLANVDGFHEIWTGLKAQYAHAISNSGLNFQHFAGVRDLHERLGDLINYLKNYHRNYDALIQKIERLDLKIIAESRVIGNTLSTFENPFKFSDDDDSDDDFCLTPHATDSISKQKLSNRIFMQKINAIHESIISIENNISKFAGLVGRLCHTVDETVAGYRLSIQQNSPTITNEQATLQLTIR